MKKKYIVKNAKGEVVTLNAKEQRVANVNQRIVNALGLQIDITTLTQIVKEITEQKFYHVAFADYVPVVVGQGAWGSFLNTYRSFQLGEDFTTGIINQGSGNSRLAAVSVGVDAIQVPIINWAKTIGWTVNELEQAARAGNWDVVRELEISRKTNWDLGLQKIAFLGMDGNTDVQGLLNQSGVTNNTTFIVDLISAMTAAELSTFLAGVLELYRANNGRTAMPSHFIIPESDYLGLATPTDSDFPLKSKLALMLETFQVMTGNKDFKILPSAYGDDFGGDTDTYRYVLLNYNPRSIRMDIPVDYTSTIANTLNGYQYQNVGYGQFTGVKAYRPLEMLYFTYNATP